MKKILINNTGQSRTFCPCNNGGCQARFVVGEMYLEEGQGFKISISNEVKTVEGLIPYKTSSDLVSLIQLALTIETSTEESMMDASGILIAIYRGLDSEFLIFADPKDENKTLSKDNEYDFWLVPNSKDTVKSAKRVETYPELFQSQPSYLKIGKATVYF